MRGYLLDTNIIRYWFDEGAAEHQSVLAHIAALDAATPLRVSAVTLGEVEYGHRAMEPQGDTPVQVRFNRFLREQLPLVLDIRASTSIHYGQLRARLFEQFAPGKEKKKLRPEELTDPMTAKELGIDENDLWMASQAVEYNLVLVTHDRMAHIRDVVNNLLDIEDWAS